MSTLSFSGLLPKLSVGYDDRANEAVPSRLCSSVSLLTCMASVGPVCISNPCRIPYKSPQSNLPPLTKQQPATSSRTLPNQKPTARSHVEGTLTCGAQFVKAPRPSLKTTGIQNWDVIQSAYGKLSPEPRRLTLPLPLKNTHPRHGMGCCQGIKTKLLQSRNAIICYPSLRW